MVKYAVFFILVLFYNITSAQNLGSVVTSSKSIGLPFSVGEIFIAGQLSSGIMGRYSYLLSIGFLTKVEDINSFDDLVVFPNPTNGLFEIKSKETTITNIKITDLKGQLIKKLDIQSKGDISELPPGMYFLQINDKNTFKIIKK